MIKVRNLIKRNPKIVTKHAGSFDYLSDACLREADELIKELLLKKANKLIENGDYIGYLLKARAEVGIYDFKPSDKYVELVIKLAHRLEREFLRGEKGAKQNVYLLQSTDCEGSVSVHAIFNNKANAEIALDRICSHLAMKPSFYGNVSCDEYEEWEAKLEKWNCNIPRIGNLNEVTINDGEFEIVKFELLEVSSE